jgi:molybdate transport system substrate-binding protein
VKTFCAACVPIFLLLCSACHRDEPTSTRAPRPADPPAVPGRAALTGELVVFAASSLRDPFSALGAELERAYAGARVSFSFAGSQELRTQLEHGAPADVFASADLRHMDELVRAGRVAVPVVFTRNEPVLIVSTEAAGRVRSLVDLPRAERIVLGASEVPIGRYTLQILDRAGAALGADFRARVEAKVVSRELNVKQVLTKVRLGEADAGLVYRTDALTSPELTVLTLPNDVAVIAEYPIAVVASTAHPALARAFVARVLSDAGQRTLQRAGFLPASNTGR